MAILEPAGVDGPEGRRIVSVVDPATLEPLGKVLLAGEQDVHAALARARRAAPAWAELDFDQRARHLRRLRDRLVERSDEIADVICGDTGKLRFEAFATEILMACDSLGYYARHAAELLRDERKRPHLMRHKRLTVRYRPLGVVGLITPWNFPLLLCVNPLAQALMAGNAVVVKPSEITPRVAVLLAELIAEADLPEGVAEVVVGDASAGRALVNAGCDMIAFTGSMVAGREVARACADQLVPCVLELGGKDPMIVCEDADVERAARGAIWGAFFNAGQVRTSVERVYVARGISRAFIDRVVELTQELRQGPEREGEVDVGALTHLQQLETVERHVADAVAKGARVLTGGRRNEDWAGLFYEPTVLVDVDEKMDILREETFGPCLPIRVVEDEDEAVRLANANPHGLQASVWTRDGYRARALASRLDSGGVVVDDVSVTYGITESPYGGVKHSGLGRMNGELGLKSFCRVQTLLQPRWRPKREPAWYPYQERRTRTVKRILRLLHRSPLGRLFGV
jgi:succinate-semialdehyde dehydrogenase/glutarate-semialdehyde dehydrogenase